MTTGIPAEFRTWNLLNSIEERYDVIRVVGHVLCVVGLGLHVVCSW